MAWFSALAIGAIALFAALRVGFALWRRKHVAPTPVPESAPEPEVTKGPVSAVDLSLLEQQAIEAEIAGDCERAAQLFESAGMLQRAIEQYRRAGNIQKAAELELVGMELGRMSQHFDVIGAESGSPGPGAGDEFDFEMPEPDSDYVHTHPTLPPRKNSIPAQALPSMIPTLAPNPVFSTLPPGAAVPSSTFPPARPPSTLPPARRSSAPPGKRQSLFPSFRRASSAPPGKKKSLFPSFRRASSAPPSKQLSAPPPRVPSERPKPRMPTAEELERMLGPNPTPDLGNIEIYYRLGLAQLAANDTEKALVSFTTVEEISPGYRDAEAYLAQLAPPAARTFKRGPANSNTQEKAADEPQARPKAKRGAIEEVRIANGRRDDR